MWAATGGNTHATIAQHNTPKALEKIWNLQQTLQKAASITSCGCPYACVLAPGMVKGK
jgi:hypothetical protein